MRSWRNSWLALFFNGIPYPPYGLDEFRVSGWFAHFLPQPPDVGHDSIVVLQKFLAPYRLEQFFGGNDDSLPLAEIPEDGKLDRGQLQLSLEQEAFVIVLVNDKPSNIVFMGRFSGFADGLL